MNFVIDAGVILKAYFPDEEYNADAQRLMKDYAEGGIKLHAPHLVMYEMTNAVMIAKKRERLSEQVAQEIVSEIGEIEIGLQGVDDAGRLLAMAFKYGMTAYDASYMALSETLDARLITADRKLYNAVQSSFPGIVWIGDYGKMALDKK